MNKPVTQCVQALRLGCSSQWYGIAGHLYSLESVVTSVLVGVDLQFEVNPLLGNGCYGLLYAELIAGSTGDIHDGIGVLL